MSHIQSYHRPAAILTTPDISDKAFVGQGAVIIGDVQIGAGSSIWYGSVLRGDVNYIRVGEMTNIQDGTIIHCTHDKNGDGGIGTDIGDGITIGHCVLLHACKLEDYCFIGMRATIMDGVTVETGAMVAAGALVTPGKTVPAGQLWAGSPARYMRDLTPAEAENIRYSAGHYGRIAQSYLDQGVK